MMRALTVVVGVLVAVSPIPGFAFFEDLCVSPRTGRIEACVEPTSACAQKPPPGQPCAVQLAQSVALAARPRPGRSMIHADATYFLAQALGYRADVAYWIAAYDEVADLTRYAPVDQCGHQASEKNSGAGFITATFNGFQRTNAKTDGPLYHYTLAFSPNGEGTDVHGAGGVQAVYPFHFPAPGYPVIDDVYQGTLFNLRQWAMSPSNEPGLLCAAGLTEPNGASNFSGPRCLSGRSIRGTVPALMTFNVGATIHSQTGPKVLDDSAGVVTYEQLGPWLADPKRTTGKLWKDPAAPPVPVQVARLGLYLHTLQDTASHSTFCGDDAPSPPGGSDPGSYMTFGIDSLRLVFGQSCATAPHVLGHVQETGTGQADLPLRDYTALLATLDELISFGNAVARPNGWVANPELLPPDVRGGKNAQGRSAADLEAELVGTVVAGTAWTRGEVYRSAAVTRPLQEPAPLDRLHAMNAALLTYGETVRARSKAPAQLVSLELMPGNAKDTADTSVCFH